MDLLSHGHKMCIIFYAIFQKKISEKKVKGYCRDNYFHPVNIQQTSQLKFDPALNAKFSRLCKFWSRLNSIGHKLAKKPDLKPFNRNLLSFSNSFHSRTSQKREHTDLLFETTLKLSTNQPATC